VPVRRQRHRFGCDCGARVIAHRHRNVNLTGRYGILLFPL
jgi:hypothetical protein